MPPRYRLAWPAADLLTAIEPTLDEVAEVAGALAAAYNDPHNAPLMGHAEPMSEADVIDHYRELIEGGDRPFLLYRDGVLVGDADLRDLEDGEAEFAFMIAARAAQGQGLGTRFALMIHAFGFATLELERIYAVVVPANVASRRVFEKLGYRVDERPAARDRVDEEDDVALSVTAAELELRHGAQLAQIEISEIGVR